MISAVCFVYFVHYQLVVLMCVLSVDQGHQGNCQESPGFAQSQQKETEDCSVDPGEG